MENKIQLKKEGKKVCILKEKLGLKSYDDYAFYLCLDDFAPTQSMYSNTKGEWKSDAKFVKYPENSNYIGQLKDDKYNGQGTYTFPDGAKYVGEWKDDKRNGQGTLTLPDGAKYVGEYKDDKLNGQGTYIRADGGKYVGERKDDKYNGQGTYTFADGAKYVGEWKDDKYNGQGTLTFPDGAKYVGEYKDNKLNGQGTLINSLGEEIDTSLYYKGKIVSDICEKLGLPIGTAEHRQCILRYMNKIDNED